MKIRFASLSLVILLTGCVSLTVGAKKSPLRLEADGLGTAYASVKGIHPYNGDILKFGLLDEADGSDDIVSLKLWPLFDVGVGMVGARLQVLPLAVGAGTLFYDPSPANPAKDKCKKECGEKCKKECGEKCKKECKDTCKSKCDGECKNKCGDKCKNKCDDKCKSKKDKEKSDWINDLQKREERTEG